MIPRAGSEASTYTKAFIEDMEERFVYDSSEGVLRRKNKFFPTLLDGKIVGQGYGTNTVPNVTVLQRSVQTSYVVWYLCGNGLVKEDFVLDHIDGNRQNNHIENLREVTQIQNLRHVRTGKKKLLPKGVFFRPLYGNYNTTKRYTVTICSKFVGAFAELPEAVLARCVAEIIKDWHTMHTTSPAFDWLADFGSSEIPDYKNHPIYCTMTDEQKQIFEARLNMSILA